MPHFVNRSNAHRTLRRRRNLHIENNLHNTNNVDHTKYNICSLMILYILFCIMFHDSELFIAINIIIFISGSFYGICIIIQERNLIASITNEISDIESDGEDTHETIVQAEIVDADSEVLQIEYLYPEQLYDTDSVTTIVFASPIEN